MFGLNKFWLVFKEAPLPPSELTVEVAEMIAVQQKDAKKEAERARQWRLSAKRRH
jgi:hypothetical protein